MKIETLAYGYGLIEGPRVDGAGNLYFSDVTNGGVYRRRPGGEVDTVVPKRRGVGGIALHADGGLVISGKNICHVKDGTTRVLFARDLPKTRSAKIMRRVIRATYLGRPAGDTSSLENPDAVKAVAEAR